MEEVENPMGIDDPDPTGELLTAQVRDEGDLHEHVIMNNKHQVSSHASLVHQVRLRYKQVMSSLMYAPLVRSSNSRGKIA